MARTYSFTTADQDSELPAGVTTAPVDGVTYTATATGINLVGGVIPPVMVLTDPRTAAEGGLEAEGAEPNQWIILEASASAGRFLGVYFNGPERGGQDFAIPMRGDGVMRIHNLWIGENYIVPRWPADTVGADPVTNLNFPGGSPAKIVKQPSLLGTGLVSPVTIYGSEVQGATAKIASLRVATQPAGPVNLVIDYVGPYLGIHRVGNAEWWMVRVANVGGRTATGLTVTATGTGMTFTAPATTEAIPPGEERTFFFKMTAATAGIKTVNVSVSCAQGDSVTMAGESEVDPQLTTEFLSTLVSGRAPVPTLIPRANKLARIGCWAFASQTATDLNHAVSMVRTPETTLQFGIGDMAAEEFWSWAVYWLAQHGVDYLLFEVFPYNEKGWDALAAFNASDNFGSMKYSLSYINHAGTFVSMTAVDNYLSGNGNFQATAVRTGGRITSYTIEDGGTEFDLVPTVTITGGGGSGATATATISGGVVTAIVPVNEGTGYFGAAPTVNLTKTQIRSGAGAPGPADGNGSDLYLDTTNRRLYGPKRNGAWPSSFIAIPSGYSALTSTSPQVIHAANLLLMFQYQFVPHLSSSQYLRDENTGEMCIGVWNVKELYNGVNGESNVGLAMPTTPPAHYLEWMQNTLSRIEGLLAEHGLTGGVCWEGNFNNTEKAFFAPMGFARSQSYNWFGASTNNAGCHISTPAATLSYAKTRWPLMGRTGTTIVPKVTLLTHYDHRHWVDLENPAWVIAGWNANHWREHLDDAVDFLDTISSTVTHTQREVLVTALGEGGEQEEILPCGRMQGRSLRALAEKFAPGVTIPPFVIPSDVGASVPNIEALDQYVKFPSPLPWVTATTQGVTILSGFVEPEEEVATTSWFWWFRPVNTV